MTGHHNMIGKTFWAGSCVVWPGASSTTTATATFFQGLSGRPFVSKSLATTPRQGYPALGIEPGFWYCSRMGPSDSVPHARRLPHRQTQFRASQAAPLPRSSTIIQKIPNLSDPPPLHSHTRFSYPSPPYPIFFTTLEILVRTGKNLSLCLSDKTERETLKVARLRDNEAMNH